MQRSFLSHINISIFRQLKHFKSINLRTFVHSNLRLTVKGTLKAEYLNHYIISHGLNRKHLTNQSFLKRWEGWWLGLITAKAQKSAYNCTKTAKISCLDNSWKNNFMTNVIVKEWLFSRKWLHLNDNVQIVTTKTKQKKIAFKFCTKIQKGAINQKWIS